MSGNEQQVIDLWNKTRRKTASYPFNIPIVRDTTAPGLSSEAEHDPATELPSDYLIDLLRRMLIESFGAHQVPILSTGQLGALALSATRSPFNGFINLGSGVAPNYRFGQSPIFHEMLGLPYSGNDPLAMLLCRDKARTNNFARSLGIKTPEGIFIEPATSELIEEIDESMFPVFVKPNYQGNSLGISDPLAHTKEELASKAGLLLNQYPDGIIIERFIKGLEVTVLTFRYRTDLYNVSLVMKKKSGAALSENFFRSHESKVRKKRHDCEWFLLRDLANDMAADCEALSSSVVRGLGLRDFNRNDFRVTAEGMPYLIECNAQADLNPKVSYVARLNASYFKEPYGLQWLFLATTLDRMFG